MYLPAATRVAVLAVAPWLRDPGAAELSRDALRVGFSSRPAQRAAHVPGRSVEDRKPPFVAVQAWPQVLAGATAGDLGDGVMCCTSDPLA